MSQKGKMDFKVTQDSPLDEVLIPSRSFNNFLSCPRMSQKTKNVPEIYVRSPV